MNPVTQASSIQRNLTLCAALAITGYTFPNYTEARIVLRPLRNFLKQSMGMGMGMVIRCQSISPFLAMFLAVPVLVIQR